MPTVRYSDPPDNVMTTDEECAELASIPIHLRAAHSRSSNHRLELLASTRCACFACCRHFAPGAIVEWTDFDATGQGQTAICPLCGIDSVLGDASGIVLSQAFLEEMGRHWFG